MAIERASLAALAVAAGAAATLAAVFVFQYGLGYPPCPLCLIQRIPYYVALPLALASAALPRQLGGLRRTGLILLGVIFLVSTGLGVHHAGVEWGWWAGPSDCSGLQPQGGGSAADLMNRLNNIRVISCSEAAWRFLGISMAGWNAVVSVVLALAAFAGATAPASRPRASEGGMRQR